MDPKTKKRPKSTDYTSDYKAGQDNVQILGMDVNNPVFTTSAVLVIAFIALALIFPTQSNEALLGARGWTISNFDWLFMIGGNVFVLFCLALIFLPVGRVRLGGDDARPEFTTMSWFSMLFAAGMGIGLMFWSVAEPAAYYTDWWGTPLGIEPNTPEALDAAMGATMFHWGLHPWAIYGVVALALAFFSFNKGLPLTIRSAFYPLLGERCWGPIGHVIDIIAAMATIFGLATSLGLGASQAGGGLEFLFGIENNISTQIGIIFVVTAIAVISVVRGLDGGVKLLSNINMIIAAVLMLFVILFGSITGFFGHLLNTTVSYAEYIIPLSNWIGRDDTKFYEGWTVFYWAWWISWSPFVGMFIARVSKGRTVREFMIAVLLVPTVVSIFWMSAFGGQGLDQIQAGIGELGANGLTDVTSAMFQMLNELPMVEITAFIAIILVLVFFITSSDSGSLVIDSITSGGKVETPVPQRIFWATMEGFIAAVLLFGGGSEALTALQAGAVTTGLPFVVILLLMCVSIYKGLRTEVPPKR